MSLVITLLNVLAFIAVGNINQVRCDFNSTEDYTYDNYLESRAVLDVLRERDNLIDPNFLVRQGLSGINFLKAFALTALLLKPVITLPLRIHVPALEQQELIKDIPTTTDIPTNADADLVEPPPPPRSKYQAKPFLDNIECMAEKVIRLPQHHADREMFLQINIRCKPMRPKENMMASGINFNIEVPEKMFTEEQLISMEVPPLEEFLPRTRGTTTRKTTTIKPNQVLKITEGYRPFEITDRSTTENSIGKIVEHSAKPFYWMNNFYPSSLLNNNVKTPASNSPMPVSSLTDASTSTTKMPWYLSLNTVTTGKPIYWMNMFYPNGVPGLNLNSNASSTEIPETTTMRKRRRRTRSTTTTTPLPEYEYYDVEEENNEKKTKKRRKSSVNFIKP